MMRRLFVLTVALLAATLIAGATMAHAQVKIGTVDLQRIRDESPKFKDALSEIDKMVGDFEQRRDRQTQELEELSTSLQDAEQRGLQGSSDRLRNELQRKSRDFQGIHAGDIRSGWNH
jgi:outer membrane protein